LYNKENDLSESFPQKLAVGTVVEKQYSGK
jgi:hypothetical protein